MTRSSFEAPLPPATLADAAMGHGYDGAPDASGRRWLPHIAAGGLWTTAADYAAFIVELQRALDGEPGRVLERRFVEPMVTPHDAPQYGLGVFMRGGGEQARYVSHLGDGPGFVAGFSMDVIGGRGSVVLTNGRGGIELVREIGRGIAKVEGWPDYLPEARAVLAPDPAMAGAMAGRYRLGADEELVIESRDGDLRLETVDLPGVRLYAVGVATFVCRERSGEITVELGADGTIEGLWYHLGDELGRRSSDPRPLSRLAPGERTPIGLLLEGRISEAVDAYRSLLETDPETAAAAEDRLISLGYRFLAGGRVDEALAVFGVCADLWPASANAHDSLGEALMKAGRFDEAIASYRRSLELDPGNRHAEEMIARMGQGSS